MNTRRKLLLFGKRDAPVGLLNTTEGAGAAAAFSLRMLNADLIGQDAIEVLRVSDSATMLFPLTASGVDTAAIADFCGGSDGVVGWMLDQSGNGRHAQQTALNSAPKIYDSSTGIVNRNGKLGLDFDGSQWMSFDQDTTGDDSAAMFTVIYNGLLGGANHLPLSYRNDTAFHTIFIEPDNSLRMEYHTEIGALQVIGDDTLYSDKFKSVYMDFSRPVGRFYVNGVLIGSDTEDAPLEADTNKAYLGAVDSGGGAGYIGQISEHIWYKSSKYEANGLAIDANQRSYYGIS